MNPQPPPADAVKLYDALIATDPDIERKGKSSPYTSVNGNMFTILSADGTLGLRLPSPGVTPTATADRTGHLRVQGLVAVHDPGEVTGTLTGPCRARHDGELPDQSCTPGAIDPAVTQANIGSTICRSGYTTTVRPPESQTEKFKWDVAEPAYGQHDVSGELDHLVALELGGANDARNLWVEAGSIPNPKDAVEDALKKAVCDGKVKLRAAQEAIAQNWLTAEAALGLGGSG